MFKLITHSVGRVLSLGVIVLLNGCPVVPVTEPGIPESLPHELDTASYHIVRPGETLYGIATLYGRDYKEVADWNEISSSYALTPGQRLRIDGPKKRLARPLNPEAGIPVETAPPPVSTPISPLPPVVEPSSPPQSAEGIHIVEAGETLYAIARRYGQNPGDVATWNNIEAPYSLMVGQTLVVSPSKGWDSLSTPLPTEPTVFEPEPSSPADGDRDYHTVLPGDTLYKIAKHYGFALTEIAGWNGIEPPYNLSLGQSLRVSPPDTDTITPSSNLSPSDTFDDDEDSSAYHFVAMGDTLYSIARRYGHSVQDITQWNNLSSSGLSLGQKLRVTPPSTMIPGLTTPDSSYLRPVGLSPLPDHHIVTKGESLSSIARKYSLSVNELAELNGIGSPYTVYPGMRLTIAPR
ncbi:MAG TPA: hypothetical protein DCM38_05155 [Gammaproteobacteria bacterium]|nr:hypothetical protein [Gammaproteobacteria bacterium]